MAYGISQRAAQILSLIHISEPTRRTPISYAVFCLKKKKKYAVFYLKKKMVIKCIHTISCVTITYGK